MGMESVARIDEYNTCCSCTKIKAIENVYDLNEFGSILDELSKRVETDVDFLKFCLTNPISDEPKFVVVYSSETESTSALLIGRIQPKPLIAKLGYKNLFKISTVCLEIFYEGILGDFSDSQVSDVLTQLRKFIKQNNIDYIFFRSLKEDSPFYKGINKNVNFLNRNFIIDSKLRWGIKLPDSFDEYYKNRSRNTRANIRNFRNRMERSFSERYRIKCYSNESDVEQVFNDIEQISSKSWQHEMGVGFSKTEERRRDWTYFASRNLLCTYFLYIDEKPVAYWNWVRYKKNLLGDFTNYDPEYQYYSPALFLMVETINKVISKGEIKFLEFGLIDTHYKKEYCNINFREADRYIFSQSLRGLSLWMVHNFVSGVNQFIKYILSHLKILEKVKSNWRKKFTIVQKS